MSLLASLPIVGLAAQSAAPEPGVGFGGSVGFDQVGGAASEAVRSAPSSDVFLQVDAPFGVLMRAGLHFSTHNLGDLSHAYRTFSAYVEPRYAPLLFSSAWAPFLAGHVGRAWETVDEATATLSASGLSLGGGGGVLVRLAPQVTLEIGAMVGGVRFGDYVFHGEQRWFECLNGLADGTPLTESAVHCNGAPGIGAVSLCYPPFFSPALPMSGDCVPPDILYAGTGRPVTWRRVWLGLFIALVRP